MRSFVPLLIIGALLVVYTSALECYTGYAIIRGRSVGTEKETCKKESDSCYRMTVDVSLEDSFWQAKNVLQAISANCRA